MRRCWGSTSAGRSTSSAGCSSTSARRSWLPAAIALGYGEAVWPFLVAGAVTFACGAGVERAHRRQGAHRPARGLPRRLAGLAADRGLRRAAVRARRAAARRTRSTPCSSRCPASRRRGRRRSPASATCRARWRCGARSRPGSAASGSSSCSSPCCRACASAAARRSSRPSPRGRSWGWRRRSARSARRFVVLYVAITAAEVAILTVFGLTGIDPRMTFYNAVALSFATIATAGFSPDPRSLEPFAPASQWVVVVFMVVAGTNFALLYAGIIGRRLGVFRRDEEFKVALGLLAAASLVVVVGLVSQDVLEGERGGPRRRLQHGVDDDHHRVRQRGLQPVDGADVDGAVRRHAARRLGRVDERLDQADPPHRDRQDAAARDRPDAAPGRGQRRCGSTARSSTSARCARSSSSSSSTSACGPRARSRSCSTRRCRASS